MIKNIVIDTLSAWISNNIGKVALLKRSTRRLQLKFYIRLLVTGNQVYKQSL